MDKAQKGVIIDKLLALDFKEVKAINRALRYYTKKFRGKHNVQSVGAYLKEAEYVQRHLNTLNAIERNLVEVIMEGYNKKMISVHPYTLVAGIPKHNASYTFIKERMSKADIELLIGALAMYRATPGIAVKYKRECVDLRSKIFGGVVND